MQKNKKKIGKNGYFFNLPAPWGNNLKTKNNCWKFCLSGECIASTSLARLGKNYGASTVSPAAIYEFKCKKKNKKKYPHVFINTYSSKKYKSKRKNKQSFFPKMKKEILDFLEKHPWGIS